MSAPTVDDARWAALTRRSETYTCYSSALAAWAALGGEDWQDLVDTRLHLVVGDAGDGLLAFAHFRAGLAGRLGLARRSGADAGAAAGAIVAELERSGRVIVAGDGHALPWHVAHGRRHVPHWFVLAGTPEAPVVVDPFSARNDLGLQEPALVAVDAADLPVLAQTELAGDAVVRLREAFALGHDARPVSSEPFGWFERAEVADAPAPTGATGPEAIRRLAGHFRDHGAERDAYRQVDDIWSIGRHRAFLAARAADSGETAWVADHLEPLAKRWSHMAPLLMQAVLAVGAGRAPSGSVATTLDELAEREDAAAAATRPNRGGAW